MKKITIREVLLLTGAFLLVLAGCKGKDESENKPSKDLSYQGAIYTDTVALTTAQEDIRNYVHYCDSLFKDTVPIRSYTINKWDIFGVLGVTDVPDCEFEHCRVYIGLTKDHKFKLYMTPTVRRKIPDGSKESVFRDTIPYDAEHETYFVYDLNAPCPSTCDPQSKLYH